MATLDQELHERLTGSSTEEQDEAEAVIEAVADTLTDLRARVARDLGHAEAYVAILRARLQRIDRVVKAAEPPKPAKKKSVARSKVSAQRIETIVSALREHPDGLTSPQLREATGLPKGSVDAAVTALRREERVRKAGVATGATGRAPSIWKLMPDA